MARYFIPKGWLMLRFNVIANLKLVFLILAALLICPPSALAQNISGTYVAKGPNSAILIQVVETENGSLSGRFEQIVLPVGTDKLQSMNATITGAVNNQTVVLTIKPAEFLGGTIAASGNIQGNLLHLTGGGSENFVLNLARSSETDFDQQVALLSNHAQMIQNAKQYAKLQKDTQAITKGLVHFPVYAKGMITKLGVANQRYRQITSGMQAALERERVTRSSFARGQIFYRIGQGSFEADQIYREIRVDESNAGYDHGRISEGPISEKAVAVKQFCVKYRSTPDCLNFISAYREYQLNAMILAQSFQESEEVWAQEHAKQKNIDQEGDAVAEEPESASEGTR
jgi:hypothetical protein